VFDGDLEQKQSKHWRRNNVDSCSSCEERLFTPHKRGHPRHIPDNVIILTFYFGAELKLAVDINRRSFEALRRTAGIRRFR